MTARTTGHPAAATSPPFGGGGSGNQATNEMYCNGYPAGNYVTSGFAIGGACRAAIYSAPFRRP